jgi:hypothetical protein
MGLASGFQNFGLLLTLAFAVGILGFGPASVIALRRKVRRDSN